MTKNEQLEFITHSEFYAKYIDKFNILNLSKEEEEYYRKQYNIISLKGKQFVIADDYFKTKLILLAKSLECDNLLLVFELFKLQYKINELEEKLNEIN